MPRPSSCSSVNNTRAEGNNARRLPKSWLLTTGVSRMFAVDGAFLMSITMYPEPRISLRSARAAVDSGMAVTTTTAVLTRSLGFTE